MIGEGDLGAAQPERGKEDRMRTPLPTRAQTVLRGATTTTRKTGRLQFIDFTRGVVMAIMAWDHASGFWNSSHHGGEGVMGAMPPFVNLTWFLLRFVSHYCAPTFIFLAGTVLALSAAKRLDNGESQWSVSSHMMKRGIALLILEALVVAPAFGASRFYFGVIACIGVCLIILSVARRLPPIVILTLSLIIVLNHPYLDLGFIPNDTWWGWYLRVIIHEPNSQWPPFTGLYPVIPWIGVMGLGWSLGTHLTGLNGDETKQLKRPLIMAGVSCLVAWFVVRALNGYGNLLPRLGNTAIDWLYVSKYPPSLAFLLWTLGGMCLIMALGLELQDRPNFNGGLTGMIQTFGRNPLFFYLAHLWLYRLRPPGVPRYNFSLPLVPTLGLWLLGLLILWQLCIRYERLKRAHPDSPLKYI